MPLLQVRQAARRLGVVTRAEDADSHLEEIKRLLVAAVHPSRLVLFGSHARGEPQPDSDLDILVVLPSSTATGAPFVRSGHSRTWLEASMSSSRASRRRGRADESPGPCSTRPSPKDARSTKMAPDACQAEATKWLASACGDLRGAQAIIRSEGAPARLAAFLAQQAVEKALKAGLFLSEVPVPRSHSLDRLLGLLPHHWVVHGAVAVTVEPASSSSSFSTSAGLMAIRHRPNQRGATPILCQASELRIFAITASPAIRTSMTARMNDETLPDRAVPTNRTALLVNRARRTILGC